MRIKDKGIYMNKTPLTKEWCWLTVGERRAESYHKNACLTL
jgi:hypothetical protein